MVNSSTPTPYQPLAPGMRRMLYTASMLVFAVGIPLYLLTTRTDVFFAWTIQSPLTAAFLGASYWASFVLEFMAARERLWANARVAVPAVITFTALTLVVTLLHIDRFHFGAPSLLTRAGTWVWLAIYAGVPIVMGLLTVLQMRAPGASPPRDQPLPRWIRAILAINAVALFLPGVAMMITPDAVSPIWPWSLTALTGRAIGAWLIGLGIAAGHAAWEDDLRRGRPVLVSAVVFSVLQAIALLRYAGEVEWGNPILWLYLILLADFLAMGAGGWARRRSMQPLPASK